MNVDYELAVVVAADSNYQWPALLALISAGSRSNVPTLCILLGDELDESFLDLAQAALSRFGLPFAHFAADMEGLDSLPLGHHFSRTTYARLEAPALASRYARRTLYLDADTLTVGDISPLADLVLGPEQIAAAVRARGIPTLSSPGGVKDWEQRELDPNAPFFNAGVLLIDNEAWASARISERVLDALRSTPDSATFADQGTLNAILQGRWAELATDWNHEIVRTPAVRLGPVVVSRRFAARVRNVRILHYFQSVKPWQETYPPGYFGHIYHRTWARLLPAAPPPRRSYLRWLGRRMGVA